MLELNETNLLEYLRQRRWIDSPAARCQTLSGGVSNAVFRVETPERAFVVKQSRAQLRTRDAWFSDLERVYREQEVMQLLQPLLPHSVPEVLFADRDNFVFAMSAAPPDAQVWKAQLLAGEVDRTLGERSGALLAAIHQGTSESPDLAKTLGDQTVFTQLRIDPFYERVKERRPEVAQPIERLVLQMQTVREAVCHGDFTPKNLLVHPTGLTLVDYETAHFGDPTMDLGLFLCHLLLKAAYRPELRNSYFDLLRAFWQAYAGHAQFRSAAELEGRGIAHCGACLLARVDGTSPVDYLGEPARAGVRRLGIWVLLKHPTRWDDVVGHCDEELAGS